MRPRRTTTSRTAGAAGPLAGLSGFTGVELVATGGTSQVFRARQAALDRTVAVKVIAQAADPRSGARFGRELAITGRLSAHPLLVTIHGHGVSDAGYPYLVMPWYDGGSLDDALRRGPLPVPQALRAGVRMAAALAHVHAQGLVHRDVKPANVLLTGDGDAVLADFGGAVAGRDARGATTVVSPLHAAPEVIRGDPAGPRSDVWALASTLCTVLAGLPPFVVAAHGGAFVRDLTRLDAAPPPLARPDVPDALRSLLASALAPRPEHRPAAAELVTGLQRIEAGIGLPVTDVPAPTAPARRRARPRPPLAAVPTPVPGASTPQPDAVPAPAAPLRWTPTRPVAASPVDSLPPAGSPSPPRAWPVPDDVTMLRPAQAAAGRSRRANAGLAAAGALTGAAAALVVLVSGNALLGADSAIDRAPTVERIAPGTDATRP